MCERFLNFIIWNNKNLGESDSILINTESKSQTKSSHKWVIKYLLRYTFDQKMGYEQTQRPPQTCPHAHVFLKIPALNVIFPRFKLDGFELPFVLLNSSNRTWIAFQEQKQATERSLN